MIRALGRGALVIERLESTNGRASAAVDEHAPMPEYRAELIGTHYASRGSTPMAAVLQLAALLMQLRGIELGDAMGEVRSK